MLSSDCETMAWASLTSISDDGEILLWLILQDKEQLGFSVRTYLVSTGTSPVGDVPVLCFPIRTSY